jgi:glucokinase
MISIGIDIGGSFIKAAVVDKKGRVLHHKNTAHFAKTPYELIKKTADLINNVKTFYKTDKIILGIGIAGIIDGKKGIIRYTPNLNKWKNVHFSKRIKELVKLKAIVENDADMAAYGAHAYELNKKYENILTVTLGTGIGGGVIIGGRLYRGANSGAGEIGHTKINLTDSPLCSCGERGCLESYAGGYGTLNLAKRLLSAFKGRTKLTKKDLSTENLNLAAQRGDPLALKAWQEMGFYLGRGLANAVLILNPEIIVITGGLTKAHGFFMPSVKKVFAGQKISRPFENLKIKISKTTNLGAIGAALYAKSQNG